MWCYLESSEVLTAMLPPPPFSLSLFCIVVMSGCFRFPEFCLKTQQKGNNQPKRILVVKPQGREHRYEDNIKMYLREIWCGGMQWIHENRDHWWAFFNTAMKIPFSKVLGYSRVSGNWWFLKMDSAPWNQLVTSFSQWPRRQKIVQDALPTSIKYHSHVFKFWDLVFVQCT
jgi:hypothetical protein